MKPSATVIKRTHFHGQAFPTLPHHRAGPGFTRPVLCPRQAYGVGAAAAVQGRLCRVPSGPQPLRIRLCSLEALLLHSPCCCSTVRRLGKDREELCPKSPQSLELTVMAPLSRCPEEGPSLLSEGPVLCTPRGQRMARERVWLTHCQAPEVAELGLRVQCSSH